MKYIEIYGETEPRLQLGQITGSEQNGRVHSMQAKLVGADGTPLREGVIKTFIPVAEIEVLDKDGYADTKFNRLSSNGKWLVKVGGGSSDLNEFDGLAVK